MSGAPDGDAPLRLFVALWPDDGVRAALAESGQQWAWSPGAVRVSPARLHLTLHFLGDVAPDRIAPLRTALERPLRPFSIVLSRATLWRGGIAVLEAEQVAPPLAGLHAALGARLRQLGLRTEARALRPHVTFARRAAGAIPPARVGPIEWRVDGYVLAASRGAAGYEIVQRYPAAAGAALERSQRAAGADPLQ